jgi:lysyl-tRNA synthetase class 2
VRHAQLPDAAAIARRADNWQRRRRSGMSDALRHERLRRRGEMLARLRQFFADRGFLEVETPLLDDEIIPELHIEPLAVPEDRRTLWLQASPELHMKRLLAQGLPAIYQVTRSFRRGERGALHNPEFTIVEWYRTGDDMNAGVTLLDELCQQVAGAPPALRTTYGDAFRRHAGVDPYRVSCDELIAAALRFGVAVPTTFDRDDRDEWLNLLLAMVVEPKLGSPGPEILLDYPASQSALARTVTRNGVEVAERFELYWRGIELANGYHELTDGDALRARLEVVNRRRAADDRSALPLPERLLTAMESPGLPPCAGCALGFDRLVMLACGATTIDEVMDFYWPAG